MQSKVSMVIPCYNKEKFISKMFDSILAQKWDNIELIIVNDGSTDKTLEIIKEYESRFINRGYEVILIDQDNQDVAAATRNGLLRASGDYICQIDADDELDPCYASLMAEWLDKNPDYEWVACDGISIGDRSTIHLTPLTYDEDPQRLAEKWMFQEKSRAIWYFLVRMSYIKKCNVIESFYVGRDGNQEAQFFLPLALGYGKVKLLNKVLYKHTMCGLQNHRSFCTDYEALKKRYDGFINSFIEIITRLQINENEKKRLLAISEIEHTMIVLRICVYNSYNQRVINEILEILLKKIDRYFKSSTNAYNNLAYTYPLFFCTAIKDCILRVVPEKSKIPKGRVIAWGAKGKNAMRLLPQLSGTPFEPTDFWDEKFDDKVIMKPDISSLSARDVVLVLPTQADVASEIYASLDKKMCQVISYESLNTFVSELLFPGFYNSTIRFMPELV